MDDQKLYKPVHVGEGRSIAERYDKSMVLILAYDPVHRLTHATTYGASAADKVRAAAWGEACARLVCGDGFSKSQSFEDFRFVDQARRARKIELLMQAAQAADHAIGSVMATRDGISDELLQSVRAALQAAIRESDG